MLRTTLRRKLINLCDPRDVIFWAGTWGLTDQELADAVAAVGPVIQDVAAHLGEPIEEDPLQRAKDLRLSDIVALLAYEVGRSLDLAAVAPSRSGK